MTPGVTSRAPRKQPSLLGVGTVVWLASELMFFGGLFAAYITLRSNAAEWPPDTVHLEYVEATIATIVLIVSSFTIHLATTARERGERVLMQRWLIITLALGTIFLVNQIREFYVLDFTAGSSGFGSMYYLLTGFHALHVFGGLALILVAIILTTGPGTLERRGPAVESVTYYWHFVDIVWILVFLMIFVLG